MQLIRLLILRSFFSRPIRTLLCIFGIMIGVGGILAIGITNHAAMDSITDLFEESSGRTNLMVTPTTGNQGFSSLVLRSIKNIPGVQVALPTIKAQTILADQSTQTELGLTLFGPENSGLLLYGVDPNLEPIVRDYRITTGQFLSSNLAAYEIVLVENYAEEQDIDIGDSIDLITPNGIEQIKVIGLMAREGPGQTNNGTFGIIPIETAQKMFSRIGKYDQLDIMLTDSSNNKIVESKRLEIQNRIGQEYAVTYPAGQGDRMTKMLYTYQIGLNFLSGIALFVGAFLIYNAFAMTVVERTREFGMLRTVGMTKMQITFQLIIEAILMGIIGSALGVVLGIFGSRGLTAIMGSLLKTDLNQNLAIPPTTLTLSLIVGIVVTIIGAAMPAIQAGNISPIEALRIRGTYNEIWLTKTGWKLGSILMVIATTLLIFNPFPDDPQFTVGSATIFLFFSGITLVIPATTVVWDQVSRPFFQGIYGNSGTIGSRNIQRAKLRTTLTVGALLIGVAMIIVVRSMTAAFTNDVSAWVTSYLGGDFYIHSNLTLRSDLARQIGNLKNIEAATPINYLPVDYQLPDGKYESLTFMAIDTPTYIKVSDFIFSESNTDEQASIEKLVTEDAIFISSVIAEKYGLQIGDYMPLRTRSGVKPFIIANVVVDFFNEGLVVTGNWHIMRRDFRVNEISAITVKAVENASPDDVQAEIEEIFGERYNLTIESNISLRQRVFNLMDQAFSMFDVMAVLAVIIASFGLVNTLTMNVMERMREIGMLRAIGMSRFQVIKMILAEAGLMGIIGGVLGMGFGILLSRIFIYSMISAVGYTLNYVLPTSAIIVSLILALFVSQFAAIQPARRASNSNIIEALHYE